MDNDTALEFEGIIGRSRDMQNTFELIRKVASMDASVLIQGESGTGKELVARAVHRRSTRNGGPFVPINCGAFPETLLESELFGHEKGAFTGAVALRKGAFEAASGGTLFLDEIGETTPSTQVALLRVLQDGVVRRVGGTGSFETDVRLISATNRNLKLAMDENSFRDDLFYRINVITITLPPLRDRMEDLPLLVERFIALFAEKSGKRVKGISAGVRERLNRYRWPGNVRELKNVIERAVIMAAGDVIRRRDLPVTFNENIAHFPRKTRRTDVPYKQAKDELEKLYFSDMLRRTEGNISKAAELSGVDRKTIRKIIHKHHLNITF